MSICTGNVISLVTHKTQTIIIRIINAKYRKKCMNADCSLLGKYPTCLVISIGACLIAPYFAFRVATRVT